MLPSTDLAILGKQNDGYRAAKAPADGLPMLRSEVLALLQGSALLGQTVRLDAGESVSCPGKIAGSDSAAEPAPSASHLPDC